VIGRSQLHTLVHVCVWSVSRGLQHGRLDGRCCVLSSVAVNGEKEDLDGRSENKYLLPEG